MTKQARLLLLFVLTGAALALPAAAWAHAALLKTVPEPSRVLGKAPPQVLLTYSEPVEPRFAIVSVTDAAGRQVTSEPPARSASNPDELIVPLRHVSEGWYLVYWRVVSVDGHPVRGAFTFAVGPNEGPPPQFVIPSISETAATPALLIARWATVLALLAAIGLFILRILIARPLVARVPGASLRRLTIAFIVAIGAALVATPVYLVLSTAKFSLRSAFDLGAVVPLVRASSFGRGLVDLEIVLALFAIAALVAVWLDRPERKVRSIAALLALAGALVAAGAAVLIPSLNGHAGQTSPRGLAIPVDWIHVAAGSVWIGGLIGLLVLWSALGRERRLQGLSVVVPRFSNVALASVIALIGSGIGNALFHLPTLGSLWQTSYGQSLIAKIALLLTAMALASANLLRNTPRLRAAAASPEPAARAAPLLRRLVAGESVVLVGAVFAAALITSLAPPAKALGEFGHAQAKVGPGPVRKVVQEGAYRLEFRVSPNKVAVPNSFAVRITKDGKPVTGADVTAEFSMLDMEMGRLAYRLPERKPGLFERSAPALVMVGHWGLAFDVRPSGGNPFTVLLVDKAQG